MAVEVEYDSEGKIKQFKFRASGKEVAGMLSPIADDTAYDKLYAEKESLEDRVAQLEKKVRSAQFNRDSWKQGYDKLYEEREEWKRRIHADETVKNYEALRRIHVWLGQEFSSKYTVPSRYRREGAQLVVDKIAELVVTFKNAVEG